jgi:cytochrome c-type biogenesis protein CcmH/NrfG
MRSLSGASLALVAMLSLGSLASSVGCAKVGEIRARKAFKSANQSYQAQDYKLAAEYYEEAIQVAPDTQAAHQSYFFLGNSYDNLYKPSKKGDAANDALLEKAVTNYQKAAESLSASPDASDKKLGKLALQYLVSSYGADKLNDPAKAEPVVQRMIQLEPGEPTNYFALAKIYEDAGAYDEAEKMLLAAKVAKPSDPAVYMTLAGYYNRQGHFDKTVAALEERATKEPNNPEAFYTIATYYWDEAYRDFKLKENEKKAYVQKGVEAIDHALQLKPDYAEALVYKGLLLRLEANFEKDAAKQAALLKQAEQLSQQATDIRKKKAAGVVADAPK